MQVTRETILDMIRARADDAGALERAQQALPESFDTGDYQGELEKLGISAADLQTEGAGSFGQAGRADDQGQEPDEVDREAEGEGEDEATDDGPR